MSARAYIQGTVALVLGVVALVMIGTGATGYCAIYKPLRIDTRKSKTSHSPAFYPSNPVPS